MNEQMRAELDTEGYGADDVVFVGINRSGLEAYQQNLIDVTSYPLFQDVDAVDAWAQHGGGKDDMFIYDADGNLYAFLEYGGPVDTNLGVPANYEAVKQLIIDAIELP